MSQRLQLEEVILTRDLSNDLKEITKPYPQNKVFLVVDENTNRYCRPMLNDAVQIDNHHCYILNPGEEEKNLHQVQQIWQQFGAAGIDRKSLIINLGGGMVTDLGGFAASTLKRGIPFVNIPTTLLAMVDASVGGKTGINFRGLKNEIGVIHKPDFVFFFLPFLETLSSEELLSGFAEMIKVALIADAGFWKALKTTRLVPPFDDNWEKYIWRSVEIKKAIVDKDPFERGLRKALNFGHTIGHSIESQAIENGESIPHGFAIAFGMCVEAAISNDKLGLISSEYEDIVNTIRRIYGPVPSWINDPDKLIEWMKFDKKNRNNRINFSLLPMIGEVSVNQEIDEDVIRMALQRCV